ncbi:hypothetical protein BT93_L2283 [Corymbia citriodora subsp. variegata]|uniref:Uncharacterized protein n=1 Tax=Corymbia citriodora subsp. variegata TaxID=360336 RepID=A0A8T0CMU2_CORYI|nr:hypothetical protein BT93_L2283 [Corymbia citriodora subsp. variegata]
MLESLEKRVGFFDKTLNFPRDLRSSQNCRDKHLPVNLRSFHPLLNILGSGGCHCWMRELAAKFWFLLLLREPTIEISLHRNGFIHFLLWIWFLRLKNRVVSSFS